MEQLSEEGVVKSRLEAFAFETEFGGVAFEQVQGEATQDSEVLRAIEHAQAIVILAKDNIQRPAEVILNRPVGAHRSQQQVGVGRQRGNEVDRFRRNWKTVQSTPLAPDADNGLQASPPTVMADDCKGLRVG